jgi:REP element-mobilizing transposase RayT
MSHSSANLLVHVIFSTKERRHLINHELRPQLFAYMGGILREIKCKPIIIGGVEDHVHLLIQISVNDSIVHMMSALKQIHPDGHMKHMECAFLNGSVVMQRSV